MFVKFTIPTSGTKDANCADKLADGTQKCGAWTYPRDYYVGCRPTMTSSAPTRWCCRRPACGGNGTTVYTLSALIRASKPA